MAVLVTTPSSLVAATTSQIIDADFNAFAGADSIVADGSFVSTTVRAGSGDDTMFINTSTAAYCFYCN